MMFWVLLVLEIAILSLLVVLHMSRMKSGRNFRTEVSSRFQGAETRIQNFEKWVREDIRDIREDIKDIREEMADDRKAVQERLLALEHPVST